MKIECPTCHYGREVPESNIPATGATATCPKCKAKFNFIPPQSASTEQPKHDSVSVVHEGANKSANEQEDVNVSFVPVKHSDRQKILEHMIFGSLAIAMMVAALTEGFTRADYSVKLYEIISFVVPIMIGVYGLKRRWQGLLTWFFAGIMFIAIYQILVPLTPNQIKERTEKEQAELKAKIQNEKTDKALKEARVYLKEIDKKKHSYYESCKEMLIKGGPGGRLVAPSTAKFQSVSDVKYIPVEPAGAVLYFYVDSQNSFGAMIRSDCSCSVNDKTDVVLSSSCN